MAYDGREEDFTRGNRSHNKADLISSFLRYTENSEPKKIYYRWAAMTGVGALLGRKIWLPHIMNTRLFPNMYVMLMGEPGARKSLPIKLVKRLIQEAGYDKFSATKSSREKFLLDLEGIVTDEQFDASGNKLSTSAADKITEQNLWGDDSSFKEPKEVFIVADEFNQFAGTGNVDFYTTLGDMWDWDNENNNYQERVKNSKSVSIFQPTVSLLGGNTPENFTRAFPTELLGHGFLTRMLLVYGERSERMLAFPEPPSLEATLEIVELFKKVINFPLEGEVNKTHGATDLLTTIYNTWQDLEDLRFKNYSTRRFTHLLKLCLVVMVCRFEEEISEDTVLEANTILSAAEILMPKAMGQFGKNKNSDVIHKIMEFLYTSRTAATPRDIFKVVHKDLERQSQLQEILAGLAQADKIFYVEKKGWLPKRTIVKVPKYVDFERFLTREEREML